jgi:hypothetical protein
MRLAVAQEVVGEKEVVVMVRELVVVVWWCRTVGVGAASLVCVAFCIIAPVTAGSKE